MNASNKNGNSEIQSAAQRALAEVALIKSSLRQGMQGEVLSAASLRAHLAMNIIAFVLVAFLAGFEMMTGRFYQDLEMSAVYPELRHEGMIMLGVFLLVVVACCYGFLYLEAREQQQSFGVFTSKHFKFFSSLSLFSDLTLKYAVFFMLVFAMKPEWIAATLMLFTADFVLQGRFFVLPASVTLIAGATCLAIGISMFIIPVTALVWPLCAFAGLLFVNTLFILKYRAKLAAA